MDNLAKAILSGERRCTVRKTENLITMSEYYVDDTPLSPYKTLLNDPTMSINLLMWHDMLIILL